MKVTAVAKLSDGVLQGLNAHSALLFAAAHLLLKVSALTIKGLLSFLQLPGCLPLTCYCFKQLSLKPRKRRKDMPSGAIPRMSNSRKQRKAELVNGICLRKSAVCLNLLNA